LVRPFLPNRMDENPRHADTASTRKAPSLAEMVAAPAQAPRAGGLAPSALVKAAVIAVLFLAFNYWQLPPLVGKWRHDPNWSHGFVIPLFSLYLLYVRRHELLAARRRVCLLGLPLMILSTVFIFASFGLLSVNWLCNLGMVALLFSVVLYLGGPELIRLTWLPIWFLVFAMPLPTMLYTAIAVPLQELAAQLSGAALRLVGASVGVTASALTITSISGSVYPLTVAEACSGVRSLMAFLALGVAWAYLEQRPIWQRVVLVLMAGPIAIVCNILRVTITSSMFVLDHPELGQKFMHSFTGILMLGPALLLFWALSKLLQSLFVEVDEEVSTEGAD
jgi:exosortase